MAARYLEPDVRPTPGSDPLDLDTATYEVVLALCIGFSIPGLVPPLLYSEGVPPEQLVDRARTAGFLQADGRPSPQLRAVMVRDADVYQLRRLQRALVDLYCSEALPLGALARQLAGDGFVDDRIACLLEQAGTALLGTDPGEALELLELAVAAGADALATGARRAEAALGSGDLDTTARILETYFGHQPRDEGLVLPDLARAVRVSCAVWAHRGMMSRAADVQRWAAALQPPGVEPLGALALLTAGDVAGARCLVEGSAPAPSPSMHDVAAMLLAEGALLSLGPEPYTALPMLIRASDTLNATGTVAPAPELPASFAATCAIMAGNPQTALSLIQAALTSRQGGQGTRARLCLLGGWAAMLLDEPATAQGFIIEAGGPDQQPAGRDELLVRALEVGLARRAGDTSALVHAWQRAREALLHVSVDLLTVLPLNELVIAAARLKDLDGLRPHLDEAWSLLSRLGNPPLWSVPLHWSAVQAALLLERPDDLAPHAAALVRQAKTYPLAGTFATAGRAWVSVLAGRFDPAAVELTARNLAAAGFPWEGARLAGHAAARAAERADMTRLLSCARDLRPARERGARPGTGTAQETAAGPSGNHRPVGPGPRGPASRGVDARRAGGPTLSGREREIGRLVLLGRTYREISEEIFISPRTVEHHVARIKRRFGVSSRSELLARLRGLLEPAPADSTTAGGGVPVAPPERGGQNP